MPEIWLYTLVSVIAVSAISLIGVFALGFRQERLERMLFYLISFSAGALLGDVFLHLLPELMEGESAVEGGAYVLAGIMLFFLLERFINWHHSHRSHDEGVHSVVHLTIIGDALHNFLDGMIIAASFLVSVPVGIATTTAVIFHEIPQEIGQFAILVHGGWSRKKALLYNFFSALAAVVGAVLVLALAGGVSEAPSWLIGISAASFIYIAMSDLIPELQRASSGRRFSFQLLAMVIGIGLMASLLVLE